MATAKPGEKPAGAMVQQVTVTATVEAIDKNSQYVTLKGREGKTVEVKVKDPKNLEGVKVGDEAVITYTEALAISVEKAKKSHYPSPSPSEAGYGAMRHPISNEVWFLWERLSASSFAAGKPLPRGCNKSKRG